AGIRAGIDEGTEKLGYKIRESQMQKIPYVLVVGDQEEQENAVNVRQFGHQQNEHVSFQSFNDKLV
ncbi:His/Gly/Thr/Pro-type tRNA ligase C-terminal domain-containing protein, partial [Virgibacillus sp. M23]|uniref:His/Gly/Thr/Pro-type tRNA ligase C-terminal domain-containing protein n=1 Tax=Virgibacillus sp. M23 TaxID=3079030 RepID=UPI002A90ECDD